MSTIASKIVTLSIMAALGGFGLIAGPAVGEGIPAFAGDPSELKPPSEAQAPAELAVLSAETAPVARELADITSARRGARELAHARRDAVRAINESARLRRAALRGRQSGERGLEQRTAARALGVARREAVRALNLAHREGVLSIAESAGEGDDPGPRERGRAQRARRGR